jgi:biliverdin reductase
VVGVGVAGRARAAAITRDPRARLASVWRGRYAAESGVPVVASFEAAIRAAHAVAICSPTAVHAEQVRSVLEAGRHALVEFPIAPTVDEAAALFRLAHERDRVLHVEHIELLDATSATLAAHVRPDIVTSATVSFDHSGPADASPDVLALGNVARLHRLTAVGGPIGAIDAVDARPGVLEADVTFTSGAPARCVFRQGPTLARRTRLEFRTLAGLWEQDNDILKRNGSNQTLLGPGSLFERDQRLATARILDGSPPYVSEARVLHVLDVVERLGLRRTGAVPPPADVGGPP